MEKIIYQGNTKEGKNITIRYPVKTDAKSMRNYINTLSKEKTYIRFQGEQVTLKDEKKYLENLLKKIKNKKAIHLLAEVDEEIVGISDINMMDKIESHIGVFGVSIAKKYRGMGIGKILMSLVLNESKKLPNLRIITLQVFATNKLAQKLYKQFGFAKYGLLSGGVFHKGKYIDDIYMYKIVKN